MAFQYLFAPTTQFQARTGANNTAGFLRVFYTQTDDRAVTYSDFGGTENEADIVLDNDGRAVVIVDDSKTYRLEVYGVNRNLLFTVDPLTAVGGGSGGASITKVISTDGTVGITVTSIGGMVTYDLSTSFEDKPSHWGNVISMISELDGTNDWVQIPAVSSVGTSLYDNGWTVDKDTGYDIAASVEMPTGSNTAIYGIDVKCEFQVDGVTVQTETGRIDPTTPMDRVSFEWKGELTKDQKVDAKLYVKNGEAITLGLVGRALFNEECDGIIGTGNGGEYIPGEYIDISTANVISVTGVQPLSGMSAYAYNSALSSYVSNSAFTSYSSTVENILINMENNVSDLSSTVSGLTGTYLEQSASALFAPSGDYAYNSSISSKVDQSAFDNCCSAMSSTVSALETSVTAISSNVSGLTGVYLEQSASSLFQPSGDYAYNSALSGKLDTSAFSGVSGNFVQNSAFTSYTASALTAIDNSISSIQSSMSSMSSDVSGKVDTSSMSAWIPYSALDYSGSAISGIGGSSLAGMGSSGADYTGVYPVNVDNTAREIAVDSLPLVTDSSMTSYASGDSSVIGVAPGVFFSSLPVSASAGTDSAYYGLQSAKLRSQYDGVDVMPNEVRLWHNGVSASVDYDSINKWNSAASSVSGKLDATAQVVTATATQLYAGTAYLTSVNGAPVSASRAGQAANASLATSAYYDGTGRLISALPDSAAVSSIASSYGYGKVDKSAISAESASWNSVYSTVAANSASWTGGGGGGAYTSPSGTIVVAGSTLEGTNSAALTSASGGFYETPALTSTTVNIGSSPVLLTYATLPSTSTGGDIVFRFMSTTYGGELYVSGRDQEYNIYSASAKLGTGVVTASITQGPMVNQIYAWTDGVWVNAVDLVISADPQVFVTGVAKLAWESSVSSKLDTTAFSTVSGSFLTAVPGTYATKTYVDSSVSSKLDSTAFSTVSAGFLTAVPAGYASETYVDSSVSGKQDSSAMSAYLPFSAISADENSAITSINGSSIGGGGVTGDYVEKSATLVTIGSSVTADGTSFVQGSKNTATYFSLVQGLENSSNANNAMLQGYQNRGSGANVFAQGTKNSAFGNGFAQGDITKAVESSLAQGSRCTALSFSFAQGYLNSASGQSFVQGYANTAYNKSFAQGLGIVAKNTAAAFGTYNISSDGDVSTGNSAAFAIGDGTAANARHNLMLVTKDGEITMYSSTADTVGTGIMSSIRAISAAATGGGVDSATVSAIASSYAESAASSRMYSSAMQVVANSSQATATGVLYILTGGV